MRNFIWWLWSGGLQNSLWWRRWQIITDVFVIVTIFVFMFETTNAAAQLVCLAILVFMGFLLWHDWDKVKELTRHD